MPKPTRTSRTDGTTGHTTSAGLHFQILGPLRFWRGGVEVNPGAQQQRLLLALLLARAGRPISTESLIELVWGSDAPAAARNVVHKYVGALRRLMEPTLSPRETGSYLQRHGNGYLLTAGPGMVVDLLTFGEFTRAARVSLAAERREEALDRYVEALQLWRGSTGDALAYGSAATSIFAALDGDFLDVCAVAAELAVALGQPARVLPSLRLAASIAPLHEQVQASLIYTLAAAGQQAEALSVFQTIRARLAEELGLDPGEGLQKVHRQVLSQSVTPAQTVGATGAPPALPRTPLTRPAQLPPDLPIFVGRTEELATLSEWVKTCDAARTGPLIIALDGMGGVGKSTLATHFAHQIAHEFVDGQLCLDLRGHDGENDMPPAEALRSLLSSQGVRVSSMPETFEALVGTWRSLTAGQRVLILLDNVQDLAQVRPLLPNSAESLVLVTSRKPLVGLAALDGAYLLHLDPPDMPTARALLRRRIERMPNRSAADVAAPGDALDEIIELCGRLPLALAILGGRLSARPRLSLPALAAELRDGTQRLASFRGGRGVRDPRAAFAWSYDQLSPDAARMFRLFSAALSPGISAEAGASLAGVPPLAARTLLGELADAALLNEDEPGHFTSHVLVKAYAQELFLAEEPEADRNGAVIRLLQHYLHSSHNAMAVLMPKGTLPAPPPATVGVIPERPRTYDEAVRWFDDQHEVLHEAVRVAGEVRSAIVPWQLALRMQPWFQRSGRFHDWQDVMRLSLRSARESGDRAGEAHALRSLAGARHYFGAHQEALALLSDALRIFTESGMLLEQAVVHLNLHRTYTDLDQHENAIENSERALALYRTVGVQDAEIWTSETRGLSLVMLGASDQARQCLERALTLAEKTGRKPDESEIRISLARYLVEIGRRDDAVEQLDQARRVATETRNTLDVFQAEILLHDIRLSLGDTAGACRAWRSACDAMHAMQNGGTQSMRDAVCERGGTLNRLVDFRPRARDGRS